MSGQINDILKFGESEFSIIKLSQRINLNLSKYGIVPEDISSDCWRGYWCVYNISDNTLFLEDLYVHSKDDFYPEIEGISPVSQEKHFGKYYLYKGLHINCNYTGKILGGNKFLREYYIHTWFQHPWAYQKLLELVFEDGILIETIDQSQLADSIRERIKSDAELYRITKLSISAWITNPVASKLSLDAWWI